MHYKFGFPVCARALAKHGADAGESIAFLDAGLKKGDVFDEQKSVMLRKKDVLMGLQAEQETQELQKEVFVFLVSKPEWVDMLKKALLEGVGRIKLLNKVL